MYDLEPVSGLQAKKIFLKKATYWDNWQIFNIGCTLDNSIISTSNFQNLIIVL